MRIRSGNGEPFKARKFQPRATILLLRLKSGGPSAEAFPEANDANDEAHWMRSPSQRPSYPSRTPEQLLVLRRRVAGGFYDRPEVVRVLAARILEAGDLHPLPAVEPSRAEAD